MIKDRLYFKFKKGEYVKIRNLYSNETWYSNKPMKIITHYNYFYNLEDFDLIHETNVIQDDECIKLNRKNKLKKLTIIEK
jgi:hypothetical protein